MVASRHLGVPLPFSKEDPVPDRPALICGGCVETSHVWPISRGHPYDDASCQFVKYSHAARVQVHIRTLSATVSAQVTHLLQLVSRSSKSPRTVHSART